MPRPSRNFRRFRRPRVRPPSRQCPIIDRNEWNFFECPDNEVNFCFLYEYTREASGEITPSLREGVAALRQKVTDPTSFDALSAFALDLVGPGAGTWRLIVAFPEWPAKPYLSLDTEERSRRLKALFPDDYPTHSIANAKDILPARIPRDFVAGVEAAIKEYGLPIIPVGSGCWSVAEMESMKLKGQQIDWSGLELQPGELPQIFLGAVMFHWVRDDPSLKKSYAALLELIRPQAVPTDPLTKPKQTSTWESAYDLKALGAYRLLKRMHWKQAATLRSPLYVEQGEWIKARKRAEELLQKFGGMSPPHSTDT